MNICECTPIYNSRPVVANTHWFSNIICHFIICDMFLLNLYFYFWFFYYYFHVFALVTTKSEVLSSVTQYAMLPDFGEQWGTCLIEMECLNTRFPGFFCLHYYVHNTSRKLINKKSNALLYHRCRCRWNRRSVATPHYLFTKTKKIKKIYCPAANRTHKRGVYTLYCFFF